MRAIVLSLAFVLATPAVAEPLVWVAVQLPYDRQAGAIDWRGPLVHDDRASIVLEIDLTLTAAPPYRSTAFFSSEAECHEELEEYVVALRKWMKAPVLYRCVQFPAGLPKGVFVQ